VNEPGTAQPTKARKALTSYPARLVYAIGIVAALLLAYKAGMANGPARVVTAPTTQAPVAQAEPAVSGPVSTFTDGVYEVGRDITAGTYIAPGGADGGGCYWKRLSSLSGGVDSIIANDLTHGGQVLITVNSGEYLQVKDCGTWTKR
jgi:hypothetical protein